MGSWGDVGSSRGGFWGGLGGIWGDLGFWFLRRGFCRRIAVPLMGSER